MIDVFNVTVNQFILSQVISSVIRLTTANGSIDLVKMKSLEGTKSSVSTLVSNTKNGENICYQSPFIT